MSFDIIIQYSEVVKRHPDQLRQMEEQKRISKSKFKDIPLEQFTFGYSYHTHHAVEGQGSMMGDEFMRKMMSGELERETEEYERKRREELAKPLEQQISEALARTESRIHANYKRGTSYYADISGVPPEVEREVREDVISEWTKEQEYLSLSEEEKEKRAQDALRQLSGMGGFVGFMLKKD